MSINHESIKETIKEIFVERKELFNKRPENLNNYSLNSDIYMIAFEDIRCRLNVSLKTGRCSDLLVNQITRHELYMGEKVGNDIEVFFSKDIIDVVSDLEDGKYKSTNFIRPKSKLKGLWKAYHNCRSNMKSNSLNLFQYWFDKNNEYKQDISHLITQYKGNMKFIINAMLHKATKEKIKNRNITGEWIVFCKHNDINYYLCLATHKERDDDIYERVLRASHEYPNLKF